MLAIPFTVLVAFTFNILLVEFGAADYSGVGAAEGSVDLPALPPERCPHPHGHPDL
jgi:hypothetical protein